MRRLFKILLWLILLLILAAGAAWWWAKPPASPPFYAAPVPADAAPGTLIRSEPLSAGIPPDARAWRILFVTRNRDGIPVLDSGVVMVGANAAAPHPVVAWAHGTIGVLPGCAPSLQDDPLPHVPALQTLLDKGWAYVAADYPGLGTGGVHGYLIGRDEGQAVLDSVRAARRLPGLKLSPQTVVWGHSQGGHAALWTGIIQPDYAPDVPLSGVAALAPATDLIELLRAAQATPVGRILAAYLLVAYESAYPDMALDDQVQGHLTWLTRDMATRCMAGPRALVAAAIAALPVGTLLKRDPAEAPLGMHLAANTPAEPIAAPLFIGQGDADPLVLPGIQSRFIDTRCAAGQALTYRLYAGRDHLSLVAPESPASADLAAWTAARFAGDPAPPGCNR